MGIKGNLCVCGHWKVYHDDYGLKCRCFGCGCKHFIKSKTNFKYQNGIDHNRYPLGRITREGGKKYG